MTSMSVTTGRRLPRRPGSLSDMARTNRRLVLALDQFTSTALPFYLELIARYAAKIQRVNKQFYFHNMKYFRLCPKKVFTHILRDTKPRDRGSQVLQIS